MSKLYEAEAIIADLEEDIDNYRNRVEAKDAEILALKEQVASLQRVLAHRRDSDSEVVG